MVAFKKKAEKASEASKTSVEQNLSSQLSLTRPTSSQAKLVIEAWRVSTK